MVVVVGGEVLEVLRLELEGVEGLVGCMVGLVERLELLVVAGEVVGTVRQNLVVWGETVVSAAGLVLMVRPTVAPWYWCWSARDRWYEMVWNR